MAVALAQSFDGEIINADSMQVYRHLDAGTAKPTRAERDAVLHHLVDRWLPDGSGGRSSAGARADGGTGAPGEPREARDERRGCERSQVIERGGGRGVRTVQASDSASEPRGGPPAGEVPSRSIEPAARARWLEACGLRFGDRPGRVRLCSDSGRRGRGLARATAAWGVHCRAGTGASHPLWNRFRAAPALARPPWAVFRRRSRRDRGSVDLVGVRGFEPPTSASRTQRSTKLSHTPID